MLPDRHGPRSGLVRRPFSSPVVAHSSTRPSAIRCGYGSKMPDSGLGGIRSALALISDSTRDISSSGQISIQMATDPIQGVLDRQPPLPPRLPLLIRRRRVCSPTCPIQSRIGQTQTLIDHCFFGLSRGQLRNGIGLIQTQLPSREPGAQYRQTLESPGHPHQLGRGRMPQTRNGPTPTAEGPEPHPPETVDSDQHRSTIHRSRRRRPPPQRTTGREPHPPDRW